MYQIHLVKDRDGGGGGQALVKAEIKLNIEFALHTCTKQRWFSTFAITFTILSFITT
jgi:hypothetical protein